MVNQDLAAALCDCCGSEIYQGEPCYYVNGAWICPDCAPDFALAMLGPYKTEGGE